MALKIGSSSADTCSAGSLDERFYLKDINVCGSGSDSPLVRDMCWEESGQCNVQEFEHYIDRVFGTASVYVADNIDDTSAVSKDSLDSDEKDIFSVKTRKGLAGNKNTLLITENGKKKLPKLKKKQRKRNR